jgi:1-acyl-sn-glycerol-3-phosphate acyltransferase
LISAILLFAIKALARLLYRFDVGWIGRKLNLSEWSRIRLVVILNHTSLFEPIYSGVLPWRFLIQLANHATFPAADITVNRPIIGRFFRFLAPSVVSITRNRDTTWTDFLATCSPKSVVMIAPEGRMKRSDGLDKHGLPMTVRGGIADILAGMTWDGLVLFAYSGGLHHIHKQGQWLPRVFKRAKINLEAVDLQEFRTALGVVQPDSEGENRRSYHEFKKRVIADLESRRDRHVPLFNAIKSL